MKHAIRIAVVAIGLMSLAWGFAPAKDGGPIPLCGPNCVWQWGHCYCTY